jgi:hypothetical protein
MVSDKQKRPYKQSRLLSSLGIPNKKRERRKAKNTETTTPKARNPEASSPKRLSLNFFKSKTFSRNRSERGGNEPQETTKKGGKSRQDEKSNKPTLKAQNPEESSPKRLSINFFRPKLFSQKRTEKAGDESHGTAGEAGASRQDEKSKKTIGEESRNRLTFLKRISMSRKQSEKAGKYSHATTSKVRARQQGGKNALPLEILKVKMFPSEFSSAVTDTALPIDTIQKRGRTAKPRKSFLRAPSLSDLETLETATLETELSPNCPPSPTKTHRRIRMEAKKAPPGAAMKHPPRKKGKTEKHFPAGLPLSDSSSESARLAPKTGGGSKTTTLSASPTSPKSPTSPTLGIHLSSPTQSSVSSNPKDLPGYHRNGEHFSIGPSLASSWHDSQATVKVSNMDGIGASPHRSPRRQVVNQGSPQRKVVWDDGQGHTGTRSSQERALDSPTALSNPRPNASQNSGSHKKNSTRTSQNSEASQEKKKHEMPPKVNPEDKPKSPRSLESSKTESSGNKFHESLRRSSPKHSQPKESTPSRTGRKAGAGPPAHGPHSPKKIFAKTDIGSNPKRVSWMRELAMPESIPVGLPRHPDDKTKTVLSGERSKRPMRHEELRSRAEYAIDCETSRREKLRNQASQRSNPSPNLRKEFVGPFSSACAEITSPGLRYKVHARRNISQTGAAQQLPNRSPNKRNEFVGPFSTSSDSRSPEKRRKSAVDRGPETPVQIKNTPRYAKLLKKNFRSPLMDLPTSRAPPPVRRISAHERRPSSRTGYFASEKDAGRKSDRRRRSSKNSPKSNTSSTRPARTGGNLRTGDDFDSSMADSSLRSHRIVRHKRYGDDSPLGSHRSGSIADASMQSHRSTPIRSHRSSRPQQSPGPTDRTLRSRDSSAHFQHNMVQSNSMTNTTPRVHSRSPEQRLPQDYFPRIETPLRTRQSLYGSKSGMKTMPPATSPDRVQKKLKRISMRTDIHVVPQRTPPQTTSTLKELDEYLKDPQLPAMTSPEHKSRKVKKHDSKKRTSKVSSSGSTSVMSTPVSEKTSES